MTRKCKQCGNRTSASSGNCQSCKSKFFHAQKRIKKEGLIVDTVLGDSVSRDGRDWWIWDAKGNVLVLGKPTKGAAIWALALGATEEDNEHSDGGKSSAQLDREIDEALAR